MRRRLFSFCSACSMLAFVTTCAIWTRSHYTNDQIQWIWAGGIARGGTPKGYLEIHLYRGDYSGRPAGSYGLKHEQSSFDMPFNMPTNFERLLLYPSDNVVEWEWGGFAWYEFRHHTPSILQVEAVAPFWSIAAMTGLLPLTWAFLQLRLRGRAGKDRGLCPQCGYDLRATPSRCPECGTEADPRQSSGAGVS